MHAHYHTCCGDERSRWAYFVIKSCSLPREWTRKAGTEIRNGPPAASIFLPTRPILIHLPHSPFQHLPCPLSSPFLTNPPIRPPLPRFHPIENRKSKFKNPLDSALRIPQSAFRIPNFPSLPLRRLPPPHFRVLRVFRGLSPQSKIKIQNSKILWHAPRYHHLPNDRASRLTGWCRTSQKRRHPIKI